jgi:hypothetical protein
MDPRSPLRGGGNWTLKGGVNYTFTKVFSMQASYGIHQETTKKATNGSLDFNRSFFEGLAFYHPTETFKVGGGVRKVVDAQLKGSGAGTSIGSIDFSADPSLVVEVEWHTRHYTNIQWGLNLRYVNEKYTASSWNGAPVTGDSKDGSHFGVGLTFYF